MTSVSAPRYGCLCFAVPKKVLEHLARTTDDDEQRGLLRDQIAHTQHLRTRRAALTKDRPSPPSGRQLLHRQVFDAQGRTFLPGKLLRDEDDPPTRDKEANEAYENVGIAMQFFKTVLGRDSADGGGMRMDASVHYGFRYNNAMWTGEQMIVGDGDGRSFSGLARSLGIIAHEFTHAVTQHLVPGGLGVVLRPGHAPTLSGEAGALNESFSDVCASMIRQWHLGQDVRQADWVLGDDILADSVGKALRSLKDPGNRALTWPGDDQVKSYAQYRKTDEPHRASGIANHAFYTAAMALGGHSWESLGEVWPRGFDRLHARATFLDAAHATLAVATARHGKGSAVHRAVKEGWQKVKVLG